MTAIKGTSFLVIGRAGMDLYADPPGTPIEAATQFTSALGGSSANIAVALVRQGAKAALLTRVSDDAVGRFAMAQLDLYGIDRSLVSVVGGEARNSLAIVDTMGPDTTAVIYRNGAADFEMTEADVEWADYTSYDALVTTGTVLASGPSRGAAFRAFDLARQSGLPIVFDIDYRPYSWASANEAELTYSLAAEMADIIVGNDVEFGFLAGDYDKGLAAAERLAAVNDRIVVYKMGEKGAITFQGGTRLHTGIYPAKPLKPTGAGDAFLGSFLASLSTGKSLRDAVLRGSAAAAIVVARVGCAPAMPTATELDTFCAANTAPVF